MAALALTVAPPAALSGRPASRRVSLRSRALTVRPKALFGGGGGDGQQGGGNPFGNMGNLMEQLKKTQALVQVETAKVQQELSETEFEGFSDDETVRVVMTGNQVPVAVDITQAAYGQGKEKLEALVLEASKEAHEKSVTGMKERMKELAQTLGLPQPPAGV
mmetsp:Transcript_38228/g.97723  ORF Transcript_38228/g.97723 Transcript_38228/m.97723 type:complete len:162 (+) Transcript_38228:110-595(+)|eukprot:jgi/Tetstr1/437871/TSEL_026511.t1